MLYVGGRLTEAPLRCDGKHSFVLRSEHHINDILRGRPERSGYQGSAHVLSSLTGCYWIVKGAGAVRRVDKIY